MTEKQSLVTLINAVYKHDIMISNTLPFIASPLSIYMLTVLTTHILLPMFYKALLE
jgi:hypothetical protein